MTNLYGIDKLTAPAPHCRIFIDSGEVENFHREIYTGKRSQRAIKARLTRERCNGQRWARAMMCMDYENEAGSVFMNMETGSKTQ